MKSAQIVYHVTAKLHVVQYFINFWLCNEEKKWLNPGNGISHKHSSQYCNILFKIKRQDKQPRCQFRQSVCVF